MSRFGTVVLVCSTTLLLVTRASAQVLGLAREILGWESHAAAAHVGNFGASVGLLVDARLPELALFPRPVPPHENA
jgi:hypothetical protein